MLVFDLCSTASVCRKYVAGLNGKQKTAKKALHMQQTSKQSVLGRHKNSHCVGSAHTHFVAMTLLYTMVYIFKVGEKK